MAEVCSIDFETRSAADLKKTDAHRYFEDPTADVLCAAYAFDDGPVHTWRIGLPCPDDLRAHIAQGGKLAAWNAAFEFWAFTVVLGPRHGWPVPRIDQMIDTMAQAAAMSIPQSLDGAAKAMGLEQQKDKDGMRLIRKFSMPRKATLKDQKVWHSYMELAGRNPALAKKNANADGVCTPLDYASGIYWNEPKDHPEDFNAFVRYCAQDVEVERALRKLLVPLSEAEQKVWEFTLTMNDRGAHIDRRLVEALLDVTEQAKEVLDRRMARATGFEITACSQVAALTNWLKMQGVPADKLNKNAIEDLLATDLPEAAREAVEIRKEAAKTSTAKLVAMQNTMGKDNRVRGLHLYHGAGTGRWSGRLVQTQNMPRGTGTVKEPEEAVDDFLLGNASWIDLTYGLPMSAVSDMLRSCITASPGNRLLAADYSSIEGRVTAWVAGEQWKLDAFVANDEGRGAGMYELAAAGIFNVPAEKVTKPQRQVGKASELALGFGGGVLAYYSMANIYGIDMAPIYPILRETSEPEVMERAAERYEECAERGDTGTDVLTREAWIASEVTKVLWRQKHPQTVALWAGLQQAAHDAVESAIVYDEVMVDTVSGGKKLARVAVGTKPGSIVTYGCISYLVRRGFLWCRLPSGRCLAYGAPKIEDRETPWGAVGKSVTALGVNSVTKKWERFALYGGLATENVVQAIARDLMANGMLQAEAAGYPIVMTIHDEAVADVPIGHGTLAEFERLLCDLPGWATGLPVVASGWEGFRYRKD